MTQKKDPLIRIKNLKTHYFRSKKILKVVENISLTIDKGQTVALVGESGCGKSTLAKTLLKLTRATSGEVFFENQEILSLSTKKFFPFRKKMQMIFQDPYASLNPRMPVQEILLEPLKIHKLPSSTQVAKTLLDLVGLPISSINRYPNEFSGGQRQRIGIARTLALKPNFIIADEPVTALDTSVQAQVLNLLYRLQKDFCLSYLLIAHDLAVVKYLSQKVAIMYFGEIVEIAPTEKLFKAPNHPYTNILLSSVPNPIPTKKKATNKTPIKGETPSFLNPPKGCSFAGRCPFASKLCHEKKPPMKQVGENHFSACWLNNT